MTLSEGGRLGHFEILGPLGAGGMGVVYSARDTRLGRDVALKILPEAFVRDHGRLSRFEREARVLATLNHPGIAAIHGLEPSENGPVLVMELVEGEGLDRRLARGRIPVRQALDFARQMAAALESAHGKGIIHRDLKPSNIQLTPEGQVKLLDFGLAKALAPGDDETAATESANGSTTTGGVAGTPPYMSPEQARGEALDRRTDVWSFGCVLYEILTGGRAFPGHTAEAVAAVLEREPVWQALPAETPARLVGLLHRCLQKDRNRRLHDIADARIELEEALAGVSPPRTRRSRRVAVALVVAAGLALAVAATKDSLRGWLARSRGADAIESLAVLPLENRSGDPEQEYLADGITEALITALGRIGALRVISYTSAMRYKGVKKPLPDIARELNVDALVEGSVLRAGDRVRITVRLIGAVPERHLWTDSYDRGVGDVLVLSSEVARTISREIQIMLTAQDHARLANARPVNPEAQEAYLKGRYLLFKRTGEAVRESREFFRRAIDKEPRFALAYAALALSWVFDYGSLSPEQACSRAKAAALRALELDGSLADAHTALGHVALFYEWDWEAADREFKRALELNPGDSEAHLRSATLLAIEGRMEEAIERAKVALALNPLSLWHGDMLASVYWSAGRYDEAIEQCRRTLELDPQRSGTLTWLGKAYLGKGAYDEGITHLEKAVALSEGDPFPTQELACAYATAGRRDEARRLLGRLPMLSEPTRVAQVHAALGEKDEAFAALEKAFEIHAGDLVWLNNTAPAYDSLRSNPRFRDLLRRLNLPWRHRTDGLK